MSEQDWQTVVVKGSRRQTQQQDKSKQPTLPQSSRSSELRKIADTECGKPKILSVESRSAMAAARVALKLTQKELDMRCSFPANSCNAWESGRICPTSTQIQSLHRILGVKLERV